MNEREKEEAMVGAISEVDIEVKGAKTRKGIEKVVIFVLVLAAGASTC